jgi:hypothetical protein
MRADGSFAICGITRRGVDGGVVVGFVSAVHYVHPDKPVAEMWINEVVSSTPGARLAKDLLRAVFAAARRSAGRRVLTDRRTRRRCARTPEEASKRRRIR